MSELPDVDALRVHEPPPGGLARLRARLDGEQRRERRWWRIAVPALAALALLAWLAIGRERAAPQVAERAPTAIPDPTISTGDVTFYWVASAPASDASAPAPAPIVAGPPPVISPGSAPMP